MQYAKARKQLVGRHWEAVYNHISEMKLSDPGMIIASAYHGASQSGPYSSVRDLLATFMLK